MSTRQIYGKKRTPHHTTPHHTQRYFLRIFNISAAPPSPKALSIFRLFGRGVSGAFFGVVVARARRHWGREDGDGGADGDARNGGRWRASPDPIGGRVSAGRCPTATDASTPRLHPTATPQRHQGRTRATASPINAERAPPTATATMCL